MNQQNITTENTLRVIPEEVRRIIDSNVYEGDNRRLATTQQYEYQRRGRIPRRERYCAKEINQRIGTE